MGIFDIQNLIQLVHTSGVSRYKNYFSVKRPGTKIQKLYDGIMNATLESDEIAAKSIYNSHSTDKNYMMLRRDLIDDLIQSTLFYDFSQGMSSHAWRKIVCQKKLAVIQILLAVGARPTATSLAERLWQEAIQLEFTQVEIQCLRILRTTAAINGNEEKFSKYNALLNQRVAVYNEELRSEEECQHIEVYLIKMAVPPESVYTRAMAYLEDLEKVRKLYTSFELELNRYRILQYALQINHEYEKAIEISYEAENYLNEKQEHTSKTRIAEFKTTAMNCCIKIRRFDEALEIGKECLEIFQEGKRNWYSILTRILRIYLYTGKYDKAWAICVLGSSERGFSSLPVYRQEMWSVFKGYLSLFRLNTEHHSSGDLTEFSISDVTLGSTSLVQDKQGLNVALLILHILYAIRNNHNKLVATRIYLLQDYAKRYLNESEHKRTLIFLSMLKLIRKAKFDSEKAQKLAQAEYNTLLHEPEKPEVFLDSIEIVPYEVLWDWVVKNTRKTT